MVVRWDGGGVVNITVNEKRIEQVKSFKYLGSVMTEDGRSHSDVKVRIAMAKDAFNKRKELLIKGLSMTLKKKMVKYWCGRLYYVDVRRGHCYKMKSTDWKHWRCGCGEDWKR